MELHKIKERPIVYYFDIGNFGRGENIRLFFHEAGIEFEDKRIKSEDWENVKKNFINEGCFYGTMPIVEFEGKRYTQTNAILRYFSEKLNEYNGDNLEERYYIDCISDITNDWRISLIKALKSDKNALESHYENETPKFLRIINSYLSNNKGPYLLGEKLSYADITIYVMLNNDKAIEKVKNNKFSYINNFINKFEKRPNVRKYINGQN
jgi:prostaglandin-H2 D-isomerase / glutathione transferase